MITEKKISFIDYFVGFLLIGVSSIPILVGDEILIASFIFIMSIFINRRLNIESKYIYYLGIFSLLFLLVFIIYDVFKLMLYLGLVLRITLGYCALRILSKNFFKVYINILYFFALTSLIFYFSILFFPSIEAYLFDKVAAFFKTIQVSPINRDHIGLYTLEKSSAYIYGGLKRNAGPFWEPGGFGLFLNLTLLFIILTKHKISSKKVFVIVVALLTTLSTGAYLTFSLVIVFYITVKYSGNTGKLKKYFIILTFFGFTYFSYTNFVFLQNKVTQDIIKGESGARTRSKSMQLDFVKFLENPITGVGLYKETRFSKRELRDDDLMHRTSGLLALLSQFGLIGFFTFFYHMKKPIVSVLAFNRIKKNNYLFIIFIIMALGISQSIFLKPFFLGISIGLPLVKKSISRKENYPENLSL